MSAAVEEVVVAGLNSLLSAADPAVGVAAKTPSDLGTRPRFIQVRRLGGIDAVPGLDAARVDLDYFAPDEVTAGRFAQQVHDLVRFGLVGFTGAGGHVNSVTTEAGPAWRPYADTNVRSYGATYLITVHST